MYSYDPAGIYLLVIYILAGTFPFVNYKYLIMNCILQRYIYICQTLQISNKFNTGTGRQNRCNHLSRVPCVSLIYIHLATFSTYHGTECDVQHMMVRRYVMVLFVKICMHSIVSMFQNFINFIGFICAINCSIIILKLCLKTEFQYERK